MQVTTNHLQCSKTIYTFQVTKNFKRKVTGLADKFLISYTDATLRNRQMSTALPVISTCIVDTYYMCRARDSTRIIDMRGRAQIRRSDTEKQGSRTREDHSPLSSSGQSTFE